MNKFYLASIAILFSLLTACASITNDIKVDAKVDPKANLSGYKTYTWVGAGEFLNDPEMKWHSPQVQVVEEVKFLIDRELRKRGITQANSANADLGVAFFTGVDMAAMRLKKDPSTDVEMLKNVPEGGLIVALIDANRGFVIWTGLAVGDYKADQYTENEIRKRLDYAVTEMFVLY